MWFTETDAVNLSCKTASRLLPCFLNVLSLTPIFSLLNFLSVLGLPVRFGNSSVMNLSCFQVESVKMVPIKYLGVVVAFHLFVVCDAYSQSFYAVRYGKRGDNGKSNKWKHSNVRQEATVLMWISRRNRGRRKTPGSKGRRNRFGRQKNSVFHFWRKIR